METAEDPSISDETGANYLSSLATTTNTTTTTAAATTTQQPTTNTTTTTTTTTAAATTTEQPRSPKPKSKKLQIRHDAVVQFLQENGEETEPYLKDHFSEIFQVQEGTVKGWLRDLVSEGLLQTKYPDNVNVIIYFVP